MKINEHTREFFKKFSLKEKDIIRILIFSNCIFILFFIAIRFNGYIESQELPTITTDETFSADVDHKEPDNYQITVNINTDNIFLLCQLPGIGEAKASAIIEYRKENGDFTDIQDLLKVPGIGENIYNNIKDLIYIEKHQSEIPAED